MESSWPKVSGWSGFSSLLQQGKRDPALLCAQYSLSSLRTLNFHVYVSFSSSIVELEQIERSSQRNINIASKNQILFIKNMYTANWQRHRFSPDGLGLTELWFKNELLYETRQSCVSPGATCWVLTRRVKYDPTCAASAFLFAFISFTAFLFLLSSSSMVCDMPFFFAAEPDGFQYLTLIWQHFTANNFEPTGWPMNLLMLPQG